MPNMDVNNSMFNNKEEVANKLPTANEEVLITNNDNEDNQENSDKNAIEKISKLKQRKNRELGVLDDNQILNARLRSDSGKVYSSSLTVDSASQQDTTLSTVPEEENPIDCTAGMCLQGDCCRNTSKIIDMITKLQASVDDVLNKSSSQDLVNNDNAQKLSMLEDACGKNAEDIDDLGNDLKEAQFQLKMVTNIVVRQDQQIGILRQKIMELQQREMFPNLVITGIPEKQGEKPIQCFNEFVANQLEIKELIPANKAFRLGSGASRPLLIELRHPEQKKKLFSSATKLKGKTNAAGGSYFISDHLPEQLNEERRRANELIAENKRKTASHKLDMSIVKGRLIINEEPYKKSVKAPTARDILKPDDSTLATAKEIKIIKGDEHSQDKSQFGSFAAEVKNFEQIRAAYLKLKMKYTDATHVSCAFRLPGANTPQNQDYIDDGEFGCGRTMLKVLQNEEMINTVVFMVRYYGGVHLGVKRFNIFRSLTEAAVKELRQLKNPRPSPDTDQQHLKPDEESNWNVAHDPRKKSD